MSDNLLFTQIDLGAAMEEIAGDVEFIRIFMRFEFALKEKYGRQDWHKLSTLLGDPFYHQMHEDGLAQTLLRSPPHSQHNENGSLVWKKSIPPKNTHELFVSVSKVRNNLLHGGKSGHPDDNRNGSLIHESKIVLLAALARDDELRSYFEGRY